MQAGLASVTFRKLSPAEIVRLVRQAGLTGIEWGGDVHVPHGDFTAAEAVRALTLGAGLAVASYGSYYRAGESEEKGLNFTTVLATAQALGAPLIRVWAGRRGSAAAAPDYRARVADALRRIGEQARAQNIAVALECHNNTLTDTPDSAMQLMQETACANVHLYWQMKAGASHAENCAALKQMSACLANLHVHYYEPATRAQMPLAVGRADWRQYLQLALRGASRPQFALLEFVRNGEVAQFLEDAAVLRDLISEAEIE